VNSIYRYSFLDWAMAVLSHEFGHRWLYFITIEEGGVPTRSLNPRSAHPAGWVHTPAAAPVFYPQDHSCMGGSWWTDNGDGTFTSITRDLGTWLGYTWHELYLMGLAAPDEVEDWWYVRNPQPPVPDQYWPEPGVTVAGTRVPVTIDQIIAAEGPRFPAYPDSRSEFVVPFVMVTRPDTATDEEIDAVRYLCDEWMSVFATSTLERGSTRCAMSPPDVVITSPGVPPVIAPGERVSFIGDATDPDGDAVELEWDFSGAAPGMVGPGPHPVTFSVEGLYTITLSGVDETGMPDPTPATVLVSVECETPVPPDEVRGLRVARVGDSLRFTWQDLPTDPSDYVLLRAEEAPGPFLTVDSASSGASGLLYPEVSARLLFYEVAGYYEPGCLGPY
jgi:hypothetical protein